MSKAKTKIVAISKGYAEIRRSDGVTADLVRRAEAIRAAALANSPEGAEFEVVVKSVGGVGYNTGRTRVSVQCANDIARQAEAQDRVLTLAFSAAVG